MEKKFKVNYLNVTGINKNILIKDIKNAEKYFDRNGNTAKEAYRELEDEFKEKDTYAETVYLYIPGTTKDMFEVFKN